MLKIEDLNNLVVVRVIKVGDKSETVGFLNWLEEIGDDEISDRVNLEIEKFDVDIYNDVEFDIDSIHSSYPEIRFKFETSEVYEFEQINDVIDDALQNLWRNYNKSLRKNAA